jgi:hypothetical protein
MPEGMRANELALVRGAAGTRATLADWNRRPGPVLAGWLAGALAVAACLLGAVWLVSHLIAPDSTPIMIPGLYRRAELTDVGAVLFRNSLVLALHAMACVAGYIAGSTLPAEAERYSGLWRRVHDRAGTLAIAFVAGATMFSLSTQTYILGGSVSTLAAQLGVSPGLLLVALLPHAVPELTMLFLPLAAWLIASRRGDWHELMAATLVTVAIAAPILVASALVEIYVSPHLLAAIAT